MSSFSRRVAAVRELLPPLPSVLDVGFTGTSGVATMQQHLWFDAFTVATTEARDPAMCVLHHGDCDGADVTAHVTWHLAQRRPVVIHPPVNEKKRAFCEIKYGGELLPPAPYLDRNKDIVDSSDVLIAMPGGREVVRSGTWSTIRYARKIGVPRFLIWPDGRFEEDEG